MGDHFEEKTSEMDPSDRYSTSRTKTREEQSGHQEYLVQGGYEPGFEKSSKNTSEVGGQPAQGEWNSQKPQRKEAV